MYLFFQIQPGENPEVYRPSNLSRTPAEELAVEPFVVSEEEIQEQQRIQAAAAETESETASSSVGEDDESDDEENIEESAFSGNFSAEADVNMSADVSDVDVDAIVTEVEDAMDEIEGDIFSDDDDSSMDEPNLSDTMTYVPVKDELDFVEANSPET